MASILVIGKYDENLQMIFSQPVDFDSYKGLYDFILSRDRSLILLYTVYDPEGGSNYFNVQVVKYNPDLSLPQKTRRLVKAVNMGNKEKVTYLQIDGNTFTSEKATTDFSYSGRTYENQTIPLIPETDANRAKMLRSTVYGTKDQPANFKFTNVEDGVYDVYFYVWEDNNPATFSIKVQGETVLKNYRSGNKGNWNKVGPFYAFVYDNQIVIETAGGDANISGIELYKVQQRVLDQAYNLNSSKSLVIDGITFKETKKSFPFGYSGSTYENQSISLIPSTDEARAQMIRSSIYSLKTKPARFEFNVWGGRYYDIYFYQWEDNHNNSFSLNINNEYTVEKIATGSKGQWKRLGPYRTFANSNTLFIEAFGGDGNLSGVELWRVDENGGFSTSGTSANRRIAPEENFVKTTSSLKAFPNPVKNSLTISLSENKTGKISAVIVDAFGKECLKVQKELNDEKSFEANLQTLKPGIYLLKINVGGKEEIIRVSKE